MVLSVVPCDEALQVELDKEYLFRITPDTIITFISRRYRLVFALDLSPSSASVVRVLLTVGVHNTDRPPLLLYPM